MTSRLRCQRRGHGDDWQRGRHAPSEEAVYPLYTLKRYAHTRDRFSIPLYFALIYGTWRIIR
jgi:hypothetical protein